MNMVHRRMVWSHPKLRGEADSFASLSCSHPNMLNQQVHRCQISLAGYFHSWVHAWIQAPRKVHELFVSHTYTSRLKNHLCYWIVYSQTHVLRPCSSRSNCAPAASHSSGTSGEDVLSTGLETPNCALQHTYSPCTLTKFFRLFLWGFKCSVPGWVGLGANWHRWKCPLLWQGIGVRYTLKVSSKPNYSMILWDFSGVWHTYSLRLWLECRFSISAMPGSSVNILIPSSASLLCRLNILDRLQW